MKLSHVLDAVHNKPWLISPSTHANISKVLDAKISGTLAQREGVDVCGEVVEMDQMECENGVACIPISGVIGRKLSLIEKGYGCCDVEDICDELEEAENDETVNCIVLDIDTPGGMVSGTPELADKIAGCSKPVYAFTAGSIASAGYWLSAGCSAIYATKSATVGSIGVYCASLDVSRALEAQGVKVDMFSSGQYKGMGYPGIPLSESQKALLQSEVDGIFQEFKSHVTNYRPSVQDEDMQGQCFSAKDALAKGLIDEIVTSKEELLNSLM